MYAKTLVLFLALPAATALAACTTWETPSVAGSATSQTVIATNDDTCGGALAEFRAIIDNDRRMGHVAESVYAKVSKELNGAMAACNAGRSEEARRMLATTKKRYGYS